MKKSKKKSAKQTTKKQKNELLRVVKGEVRVGRVGKNFKVGLDEHKREIEEIDKSVRQITEKPNNESLRMVKGEIRVNGIGKKFKGDLEENKGGIEEIDKSVKLTTEDMGKITDVGGVKDFGGSEKQTSERPEMSFLRVVKGELRVGFENLKDFKGRVKEIKRPAKQIYETTMAGLVRVVKGGLRVGKIWLRVIRDKFVIYLPQIYRFFTARTIIILCTIYIVYNLIPLPYHLVSFTGFKNNYQAHLLLGETFLIKNNLVEAKKEFSLAYPLTKNKIEINGRLSEVNNLINEKINLEEQLGFWEKQIEEKANYRDAYLELTLLNYQTKRPSLARFYFEKAKELDPNNVIVKEIEEILR